MTGLAVEARGVRKSFGRTLVLRDLSLDVACGETVAVFGPNGAGKTTLLRLLATLYRPGQGSLRILGDDGGGAAARGRIGLVAHQSFLYPDLTALENLVFYGRLYGLADRERTAREWLARVGLAEAAARPVRVLSRGMEQRLAVARALLHDPELLLLDEPWTGLDAAAADVLHHLIADTRRAGRTVIVATHDFARALALADRAVILHRGAVAWEGSAGPDSLDTVTARYRDVTSGAVAA